MLKKALRLQLLITKKIIISYFWIDLIMDPLSQKLQHHFTKTIKDHGNCAKGVEWGSDKNAQILYDRMLDVILAPGEGVSILDVGCGYGGLQNHLGGKVENHTEKDNFSPCCAILEMIAYKGTESASFLYSSLIDWRGLT